MSKTIICLYAPANCGKTKTIRCLFLKLGGDKNKYNGECDIVSSVNFGGKIIGFASQGDPNSQQKENLVDLAEEKCDIIITASRSKGGTVDNVRDIAYAYKYDIIWFTPFYLYDAKQDLVDLYQYFAEKNADNIAKYIIDKLI